MTSGVFDKRLNETNICLIPKIERPTRMSELRPTTCATLPTKSFLKVLCQRLKRFLLTLISETQLTFVSRLLILGNILIAQEIFYALRTNKSCKNKDMAIKTDMSKAYDRVEWLFIETLLRRFGFADKWITWMM